MASRNRTLIVLLIGSCWLGLAAAALIEFDVDALASYGVRDVRFDLASRRAQILSNAKNPHIDALLDVIGFGLNLRGISVRSDYLPYEATLSDYYETYNPALEVDPQFFSSRIQKIYTAMFDTPMLQLTPDVHAYSLVQFSLDGLRRAGIEDIRFDLDSRRAQVLFRFGDTPHASFVLDILKLGLNLQDVPERPRFISYESTLRDYYARYGGSLAADSRFYTSPSSATYAALFAEERGAAAELAALTDSMSSASADLELVDGDFGVEGRSDDGDIAFDAGEPGPSGTIERNARYRHMRQALIRFSNPYSAELLDVLNDDLYGGEDSAPPGRLAGAGIEAQLAEDALQNGAAALTDIESGLQSAQLPARTGPRGSLHDEAHMTRLFLLAQYPGMRSASLRSSGLF